MDSDALRALMEKALGGSETDIRLFLEELLSAKLYVPTREQDLPIKGAASPPTGVLDILGLEHKDIEGRSYVVVPCFLSKEGSTNWASREVKLRTMDLKSIAAVIPANWSIVLEPGGEVEKEITPWEISLLAADPPQIDEVVSELLSSQDDDLFEIHGVLDSEYPELISALKTYASSEGVVTLLSLIRHESMLCLGGIVDETASASKTAEVKEALRNILALALIGNDSYRVTIGRTFDDDPLLKLFKGVSPLYTKTG